MIKKQESKTMKNEEHYYKIRCAQLNEIRKKLIAEINALNEDLAAQGMSPGLQAPSSKQTPAGKQKVSPKQAIKSPVKMQHGLAHTGSAAQAQEDILNTYSDNPNTEEKEQPRDASWQSVNSAVGNYMTQQVAKLAQSQHMA